MLLLALLVPMFATQPLPLAVHSVATSDADIDLFPLENAVAVVAGRSVAILHGDRLEGLSGAGLPESFDVEFIAGRWPEAVWLGVSRGAMDDKAGDLLFRWRAGRWSLVATAAPYQGFFAVHETSSGWLVAEGTRTVCNEVLGGSKTACDELGECWGGSPHPATPKDCPRHSKYRLVALTGSTPPGSRIDGLPTVSAALGGQLILAGGAAHIEHWSNGHVHSLPLPNVPPNRDLWLHGLALASPSEAYLGGEVGPNYDATPPYVAHFDGTAWTPVAVPFSHGLHALARASDGTFWCAAGTSKAGELWQRSPAGDWQRRLLPEQWNPHALWASPDGDLVVAVRKTGCGWPDACPSAVLRTRPWTGDVVHFEGGHAGPPAR